MKNKSAETITRKFHLGIYALIENDQCILLVKKSRGPYTGMWDLPGGSPIHGETITQTLQREVKEETGIELIDAVPHSNQAFTVQYNNCGEAISLHHTCLIYKATQFDLSQFKANIAEEDVCGSTWIEKSQLTALPLSRLVLVSLLT